MSHILAPQDGARRSFARIVPCLLALIALLFSANLVFAQCPELGPFQYFGGTNQAACPCFAQGEQAGVVFQLPANVYPIEITRVGIAWGSYFGGSGQSVEQAINIYAGGLPNPGSPIFSLVGPVLTDGVFNEFNLDPLPGQIRIESGPFTVSLEFYNANVGDYFAGTVMNDANGCQAGKNVIYAIPGGWLDACSQGVTGDWLFYIKYRSLNVAAAGSPAQTVFSNIPFNQTTCDTLVVSNTGCDTLAIAGINGCDVAPFSVDTTMTSHLVPPGGQTSILVCATPTDAGPANCSVSVTSNASNSPTVFDVSIDGVTSVSATPDAGFAITGVVPNPFNPETTIRFVLPHTMAVTAEVWSVDGSRVRTLTQGTTFAAGENSLRWDGRNGAGQSVASGVYLVRIQTPIGNRVTRAVLLE